MVWWCVGVGWCVVLCWWFVLVNVVLVFGCCIFDGLFCFVWLFVGGYWCCCVVMYWLYVWFCCYRGWLNCFGYGRRLIGCLFLLLFLVVLFVYVVGFSVKWWCCCFCCCLNNLVLLFVCCCVFVGVCDRLGWLVGYVGWWCYVWGCLWFWIMV